jgi:hypothetical protein
MNPKRSPITLALDLRSTEVVTVFADSKSEVDYPETWIRAEPGMTQSVSTDSVVVIDRVDLLRRELADVIARGPRIVAMVVGDRDQEKVFRKNLRISVRSS